MGVFAFRFPELGEGLHEGRIEKWLVKPGDAVQEDDAIAEVENDKATVELPSPVTGRVLDIKLPDGGTAVVGDLIVTFEVAGAGSADAAPALDVETAAVEQAGLEPVTESVKSAGAPPASGAGAGEASAGPAGAADLAGREVLATPGVRRFARGRGADLRRVAGTGPNGRITQADVERFLAASTALADAPGQAPDAGGAPAPAASVQTPSGPVPAGGDGAEERIPLTGIRRAIAQAMAKSAFTAPHVTIMDEADVTELVKLRAELKALAAERGVRLTYLPFIVKALVAAVRRHPLLNSAYDEERQEVAVKRDCHVGIATDTERGLLVPVVRDAGRKSLLQIAAEIDDLAARGRAGRLGPQEMRGGTISVTNIGSAGGLFFTPIIHYPEVAILGVGRITERPVIRGGEVAPAHMMALSLSFDHRMIDGVLAQRFMNDIKRLLEDPRLFLMEV